VEVNGSGKHSSLLQYTNNYNRKSFMVQAPVVIFFHDFLLRFEQKNLLFEKK